MNRSVSRIVIVALLIALVACKKDGASAPKSYPDTAEGFDAFARDLVDTIKTDRKADFMVRAKQLALPDANAWFTRVFGPETGARLLAEYQASPYPKFDQAWPDLHKIVVDKGSNTVATSRHTDPKDDLATGHQANALREMKQPVALYSLQLTRPDGEGSFRLWSFVYEGGAFRMVGKMKQAQPIDPKEDMATELDMLGELPMAEARRMMKEAREGQ